MAELIDFNFSEHWLDPTLSDKEILEKVEPFPEFLDNPGTHISVPNAVRYISLMYDMRSELREHYPDTGVRKRECALMSGFELDVETYFHETVEDMLIGENPVVNSMIVRYIRLFDNPYYLTYVTSWNLLFTEIANSFQPQESKNITTINNNIIKLNKQISDMAEIVFKGDDTKALKKALYKNMEREHLGLRPEEIASAISGGTFKPTKDLFGYKNEI